MQDTVLSVIDSDVAMNERGLMMRSAVDVDV